MSVTMITISSGARIKQSTVDSRTITFIASHERVDSHGELVKVGGIDLTRFALNPVLLLGHSYDGSAVAEVRNLRRTFIDGAPALIAEAYFPDRPRSNEALADVRSGLMNAVSIGFLALEQGPPELSGQRGPTYLRSELLEVSLVTVPACSTCLITRKEYIMKDACSCDELEITAEQFASVPSIVRSCLEETRNTYASRAQRNLEICETQLRQVPAIVRDAITEAIGQQVDVTLNRLRGRVD